MRADLATRWMGKKFHQSHLSRKSTLNMRGPDMDLLHAAHAGPSAAHDQRPWSLARNQSRMTASKGLLRVGEAVLHAHRGKGKVIGVDNNDERGKPYIISFENGEVHHYSQASALKLQKLAPEPSPRTRAKTKCDAASLVDVAVHLLPRCFADRLVDRLRRGAVHDRCLLLAPILGHLNFRDSQCRRRCACRVTSVAAACRLSSTRIPEEAEAELEAPTLTVDLSLLRRAVRAQATLTVWLEALELAVPDGVVDEVPDDVSIEQARSHFGRLAVFGFAVSRRFAALTERC